MRPHLDYGDIIYHTYDPESKLDFTKMLESTQYSAALAVSEAWRGTNTDKLYEELGWDIFTTGGGIDACVTSSTCETIRDLTFQADLDKPNCSHLHRLRLLFSVFLFTVHVFLFCLCSLSTFFLQTIRPCKLFCCVISRATETSYIMSFVCCSWYIANIIIVHFYFRFEKKSEHSLGYHYVK